MNRMKNWLTKVSGATALVLLGTLMIPLLAYAQAYIFQVSYDRSTGTVTASVYTDETVTGNVYLNLHDNNMSVIDSVYLSAPTGSYTDGNAVYDRYDFTYTVTANVYDPLKLTSWYVDPNGNGTVTSDVYTVWSRTQPGGGGNGGGSGGGDGGGPGGSGGSGSTPPPPQPDPDTGAIDGKISAAEDGTVSQEELAKELDSNVTVAIELPAGGLVKLPAKVLKAAKQNRILALNNKGIALELPLKVLNFAELEKATGAKQEELFIHAKVAPVSGEAWSRLKEQARSIGATLESQPAEFALKAVGNTGNSVPIDDFGRTYVKRTLPLETTAGADQLTGVYYNESVSSFSFVPTKFATDGNGRIVTATLQRPGNSIYAVLKHDKTFNDTASHWAEDDIHLMASKLIIEGVSSLRFEPNRDITRAEFAALLVRSLGLTASGGGGEKFSDVSNNKWYAEVVQTASEAGLINGYPDGTFGPDRTITRAEMAAMIARALAFAGMNTTITDAEAQSHIGKFTDHNELPWASHDWAVAIRAGIVTGMTDSTLAPRDNATRAQAAVMLKRLLAHITFI
ncbi:S-layer homology domain-containing protein [Paenibacillus thermotolerans]|uniref:S-layer homology domain-containing protein n=1 Tax=Paenibacillus thermotolerans TaxID=3027807 RepID=UPI0023688727|nr:MULTISPECIES: S-layer homology domain-containing protein [unclassified Paenibacillus]